MTLTLGISFLFMSLYARRAPDYSLRQGGSGDSSALYRLDLVGGHTPGDSWRQPNMREAQRARCNPSDKPKMLGYNLLVNADYLDRGWARFYHLY